ncbi:hypothetical protein DM860_012338 [Cuscuta australis]|uniref:GH18 domain-containing protein n=2 Tax=Cuscuta sect. Cleistogrammica TaxID=1824901 RepID=A0A328DUH3_9ASTE|nr:hypothetical protein DM860_012338 [Cuscuta australis]
MMNFSYHNTPLPILLLLLLLLFAAPITAAASHNKSSSHSLFREYIGAEFKNVKLSDVPVNPNVDHFHFILSFAIDYTTSSSSPSPTNGKFNVFWDSENLSPSRVSAVKSKHRNVKVAVSLGGDTVGKGNPARFAPTSITSWVSNAVTSLTRLSRHYHLDGIDIDYEHFNSDPETFAECIGRLITVLKENRVISFASIAPFDDPGVQKHYTALWKRYGHVIDYVNFQFYAYDKGTTVSQFLRHFDEQRERYRGGRVLASFLSGGGGGLSPEKGFFAACKKLKSEGKLGGIFVWCADESKSKGFKYEKRAQALLAKPSSL